MKRILIANRGEIALRVLRSLKKMGIESVVIYSEPDCGSPAVLEADIAVSIGGITPSESYLNVDKIIGVAKKYEVDGIHPGYGFLSEKLELIEKCKEIGITFIGPGVEAIRIMGDKIESKKLMQTASVPVIPGFFLEDQDFENPQEILRKAEEIGFPIMVKAAAGGGGKGMRRVDQADHLLDACETCRREAANAFADQRIFVEKFILNPRHIEFQIFGDTHGNIVHVSERECSIQRRNQKIIEECPSPRFSEQLRQKMGEAAVNCARLVDYVNAGTVEFVLGEDDSFYFLEMNTRLQVEHPITEMVHGLDLVCEQIRVAMGESLSFTQKDIRMYGHAVECRLYAEEPLNEFFPATGKILKLKWPELGPYLRIDAGIHEHSEVSVFYDPMIAKIIAWGPQRSDALKLMQRALEELVLLGVETNQSFLLTVFRERDFREGRYHTGYIQERNLVEMHRVKSGADEVEYHLLSHLSIQRSAKEDSSNVFYPQGRKV